MLFQIIIILVVAGVAYFHYVQGFFSATLSAFLAILSAVLAFSFFEPVVLGLLGGKFADVAPGMSLCVLFAVIYLVLRTAFDSFVPGNLRLPLLADKIGAAVMGIVAGLACAGILAIAAQSLPFGWSVGMYSRYTTNDERDVRLPTGGQSEDTFVYGELKDPTIDKNRDEDRNPLWVPADRLLLNTVQHLSNDGSLAGSQQLHNVHPDYLEEVFLSNVGLQVGAKRTAVNTGKGDQITVPDKGLFTVPSLNQVEGEINAIRQRADLKSKLEPGPGQMILVVRASADRNATDSDNYFRFSPGSSLLVANQKNYFPVGTLEQGTLFANALDDHLITSAGKPFDLVYLVDKADVLADPKAPANKLSIADGVFLDIKRLGRVDLSGKKVSEGLAPSKDVGIFMKPDLLKQAARSGGGASLEAAEVAPAGPLNFDSVSVDDHLPSKINTGGPEKTTNSFQTLSASGALKDGKFTKLEITGSESTERMAAGSYTVDQLAAPGSDKIVQVHMIPTGSDPWAWSNTLGNYRLVDTAGKDYQLHGVVAKLKSSQGGDRLVARFNADAPVTDSPRIDARPTDVYLLFAVPSGTHLRDLTFNEKPIAQTDSTVQ